MKMRAPKGEGALALEELDGFTAGLVALAGRPLLDARQYGVGGLLDRLVGLFGRGHVCVELQRHLLRDEEADNDALDRAGAARFACRSSPPTACASPSRPIGRCSTCSPASITSTTLDAAGRLLARNAERYLKSPEVMAQLFADRPDALAGTAALAERLEYTMADLGYRFPTYPVPAGETEMSFLRHITEAGARDRYRPYHDKARAQIARELDLIEKLDLAGYFLIVWDIVNYCRQQDILVQGRGSAANSAVCYSLGITAVDPIKMELLFERFLSEERGEWPDIDLDLPSGDRRERVIQHVYEKYGRLGAAMTANVITYRSRSAAREVGKALSLDEEQIDRLAKVMNHFEFTDPNDTLGRNLDGRRPVARHAAHADVRRAVAADPGSAAASRPALGRHGRLPGRARRRRAARARQHARPRRHPVGQGRLRRHGHRQGRPARARHDGGAAGRHRAGEHRQSDQDRQLERPTARSPMPDSFDLAHLPPDDPAVYDLLQKADTIGVFQVESRAQMATLPRLKPTHFYDLVVRGGDHPSRADRRRHGASVSESPRRAGAGRAAASVRSSRCSRARSACRCSRSSCCAWRWWPPASPAARPRSCAARWASSARRSG